MSINKFGLQLGGGSDRVTRRGSWSGGVSKNYVREHCLCKDGEVFNAKSRVIRHLADPEADTDAVNKLHLDHHLKLMSDRENRDRMLCENFKREVLSRFEDSENTERTWKRATTITSRPDT